MTHASASSARPTEKVAAVGTSGAAATVIVYVAGLLGLDLPATVAGALVLLAAFVAGYLRPTTGDPV
jgi:putative effector of murein hydrolase LrgA (UPF0299 family)